MTAERKVELISQGLACIFLFLISPSLAIVWMGLAFIDVLLGDMMLKAKLYDIFHYGFEAFRHPVGYFDICYHLDFLEQKALDAHIILEVGVRQGNSTRAFLRAAEKTGGHLISIDIQDCNNVSHSYKWIFLQGDFLTINLSYLAGKTDLVFIDSNHLETRKELDKALDLLSSKGIIIFHDALSPLVIMPLMEFQRANPSWHLELRDFNDGLAVLSRRE